MVGANFAESQVAPVPASFLPGIARIVGVARAREEAAEVNAGMRTDTAELEEKQSQSARTCLSMSVWGLTRVAVACSRLAAAANRTRVLFIVKMSFSDCE